jgi:hypothetical protein
MRSAPTLPSGSAMFDILASQPVAKQTHGPLVLNGQGKQSLSATILGMTVEVTFDGSDLLTVVAEVLLGSIEAFLATVIDQRVMPHTEKFRIDLQFDAGICPSGPGGHGPQ